MQSKATQRLLAELRQLKSREDLTNFVALPDPKNFL